MRLSFFLFIMVLPLCLAAQLRGTVSGPDGEPLPFASVYIQGTTRGATTNIAGEYVLPLEPGSYKVVFRYVGLEERVESIDMGSGARRLDVQLREQAIELDEVVVRADAEDPAYAIIRQAIAKREYYLDLIEAYRCDVYIKGNIKFLDAPEKLLGQEVGDLMGSLDSNRQGIIYLAESQSTLSFQQPDRLKETVNFTKISGDDNGFGFNSARAMHFDLYENTVELGRQIVSPIARNAMGYYDYRLVGTTYDPEGRLINKIELLPKRSEDPVFRGFVYIVEDLWLIQSADLQLLSGAMKQPGLDTLWIRQVHIPLREPDVWRMFSQDIRFGAGLFGFKLEGRFTGVYSGYDLNPQFSRGFFDNEVYRVEDGANAPTLEYWDTIRPLPLTLEERLDYRRKDSLQEVRTSRPYLDSVDASNNRFTPINLLFGYEYNRSWKGRSFSIGSPLTTVQFNTVQGFNADLRLNYRQELDADGRHWFSIEPTVNYGFSENRLRASVAGTYAFSQKWRGRVSLAGGVETTSFNPDEPISKTLNSLYSLFGRRNYLKIYERSFGRVTFQRELVNGVFFRGYLEYARRKALVNHSDYSFGDAEDRVYTSNDPQDPENYEPSFPAHDALTLGLSLRLRYRQKYVTFPGERFIQGSEWPDLWLEYRGGLAGAVRFDFLSARIQENGLSFGVVGRLAFQAEVGGFLNRDSLLFMDYQHFNGNQTVFGNPARYLNSFKRLPYFERSTDDVFFRLQAEHHFEGFLLDRVPGLRKLGWMVVAGASFLHTRPDGSYYEFSLGLDNIGFGPLRLIRVDFVSAYAAGEGWNFGGIVGLKLP